MKTVLVVAATAALLIAIAALSLRTLASRLRRLRAEALRKLREDTRGKKVYRVDDCNFFGVASRGYRQLRGNGVLALTEEGIYFRMLAPERELHIPLHAVRKVSFPRSFLGKSKGYVLLRVDFLGSEGREDAAAWIVPHPEWWGRSIEVLLEGREPDPFSAPSSSGPCGSDD
jgi:hypothetical protein